MQSLEYSKPNQIEISNTLDETSKSQKEISQEITSIHSENTKIKTSLKINNKTPKISILYSLDTNSIYNIYTSLYRTYWNL